MMIPRLVKEKIQLALKRQPAVALLGPRQVGKTSLAYLLAEEKNYLYLDLEAAEDRVKLQESKIFLQQYKNLLVIIDEIQRMPQIFTDLRGIIDEARREGRNQGLFLLLGSASLDLLQKSGETLAGRIAYIDIAPFSILETSQNSKINDKDISLDTNGLKAILIKLWQRGGFPLSYLALSDEDSFLYRRDFIRSYLERDIPILVPRLPSETLRRLWIMLAHNNGGLLNSAKLAANLSISAQSVSRYIDLLVDLMLVRRLMPYHKNVGKRLVKSPKVYIRDSGILHSLLNIKNYEDLASHTILGESFEGFVIENLLNCASEFAIAGFYRTNAGAEIDLILELPGGKIWAIEVKASLSPKIEKGFYQALQDIKPDKAFIVYLGQENYQIAEGIEVISLYKLCGILNAMD